MLSFTQKNGIEMAIPIHNIQFIQNHKNGGATIFTNIPDGDGNGFRQFRSLEAASALASSFDRRYTK